MRRDRRSGGDEWGGGGGNARGRGRGGFSRGGCGDRDREYGGPSAPASSSSSSASSSGGWSARPAARGPTMQADGPIVGAAVKWFNTEKGFGFVELSDGSGDAFLHASVLEAAGHNSAPEGATLRVRTGQGMKGKQVTEVLEVDTTTAGAGGGGGGRGPAGPGGGPAAPRRPGPSRGFQQADRGPSVEVSGAVKWYDVARGFGFVQADDGGKDIFVHASALERSGLPALAEGERVTVQVVDSPKGREAVSLTRAA